MCASKSLLLKKAQNQESTKADNLVVIIKDELAVITLKSKEMLKTVNAQEPLHLSLRSGWSLSILRGGVWIEVVVPQPEIG